MFPSVHRCLPLLAACALVAASPAQAGDMKISGVLDLNLASVQPSYAGGNGAFNFNNTQRKRVTELSAGGRSESTLAFDGRESLGGTARVMFQLETVLSGDTGQVNRDNFWARNAKVGVQDDDWGTLWAGRAQTVYFEVLKMFSPFGEASFGPSARLMLRNPLMTDLVAYQMEISGIGGADRVTALTALNVPSWNNSLTYTLPSITDLEGLSTSLQWGMKESDPNGFNLGMSMVYDGEDMDVGYAFQSVKSGLPASLAMRNDQWVFALAYDATYARLFMQLGQNKLALASNSIRSNYQQLGASIPLDERISLQTSVGRLSNKPLESWHQQFNLGGTYAFSKQTDAYADYIGEQVRSVGRKLPAGHSVVLGVRHRY
jgi:predicted porin